MIEQTSSRKGNASVTSNEWHVVHARWTGNVSTEPQFQREIVSEHPDRASALASARKLSKSLRPQQISRSPVTRDQFFVRQPGFKSLKSAGRRALKTSDSPRQAPDEK